MNLADMPVSLIEKEFSLKTFQAKQIYKWIRRGVTDALAMTDIPLALREKIKNEYKISFPRVYMKFESKIDKTKKYLILLDDGNIVETVLMSYEHGYSVCVSTQVGCRMGCAFCASTQDGLIRNLTPSEIEGQIRAVSEEAGVRVSNVVLMGIGEPLDNYDNVLSSLHAINNPDGLSIGFRHITLSTCGLTKGIKRLMEEDIPITLALSLHATEDEERRKIMPSAKSTTISELVSLMDEYANKTKRRVSYEYSLIAGVNDSLSAAEKLGKLLKGQLCHVNLIEVNPVTGKDFKRGNNKYEFVKILEKYGVNATVRRELGKDISASCGQLKKSFVKEG